MTAGDQGPATGPLCKLTAIPEMETALLEVVRTSLEMTDREEFLAGCRALLAAGQRNLVIDLRGLQRVFSVFVGTMLDLHVRAGAEGKSLKVLASEEVVRLFRSVSGGQALHIDDGLSEAERARRKTTSRRTRK